MARHIHIHLGRQTPRLLMAPVRDQAPRERDELTRTEPGHPAPSNQTASLPPGSTEQEKKE